MRFDFTDLRLFQFVVQTGSITRGAERAHLALASASARIRGMEEILGVPLLKRGRRGVEPTEAGRSLLDHARIVLQQIETMRGDLGAYSRGLKGSVRILANTSALSEHLPALLADFLAANPTIDIDLEDRESPAIGAAIAAGDADIGIGSQAALVPGLESHPFRTDRLVLAVPANHRLAGKRQTAFADLARPRLRRPAARHGTRRACGHAGRPTGSRAAAARPRQQSRRRVRDGRGGRRRGHRAGDDRVAAPARPADRDSAPGRGLVDARTRPLCARLPPPAAPGPAAVRRPAPRAADAFATSAAGDARAPPRRGSPGSPPANTR